MARLGKVYVPTYARGGIEVRGGTWGVRKYKICVLGGTAVIVRCFYVAAYGVRGGLTSVVSRLPLLFLVQNLHSVEGCRWWLQYGSTRSVSRNEG